MPKNLVIVESPAKAKTIEKFLGSDYKVTSSYGHIRDLKKHSFSIDIEQNYTPVYEIPDDKKQLVENLKKESAKVDVVWLASDEDREGEAISWHLYEVLGLQPEKTRRIVFHEITKPAILNAIQTPRAIDKNLVDAQQARRVLDRIVGFELSPILWKKVKPALSAGRVQSVAVRLIVEREREIEQFKAEESYRIVGTFLYMDEKGKQILFNAELNTRYRTKEEAAAFLEKCKNAKFNVVDIAQKPLKRVPAPPFTTSTLQQEAARKLHFSVSQTMMVAQRLYESGFITYMRTDSVNLSSLALNTAKQQIISTLGESYLHTRNYRTHTKGAQEAHEAIRPSYIDRTTIEGTANERKLYELIWKRTIASQMADAQIEKTTVEIAMTSEEIKERFIATGEVIKFDGFLRVYTESKDDDNNDEGSAPILPSLQAGQALQLSMAEATQRYTQRPPRFSEASLVKKMEELGIGRPSTYAPTISTIQAREYIEKCDKPAEKRTIGHILLKDGILRETESTETFGNDKGKLIPTDIGFVVNDFLNEHFPSILNYNFTAEVEEKFDQIADGKENWTECIDTFYRLFHPMVTTATEMRSDRKAGERILGTDPKSGHSVSVKISRFGPVVQIGAQGEVEKPQFAPLQKGQSINTITLEEALKLFELPKDLGLFETLPVVIGVGRFGPYVKHDNKYYSLPKGTDPHSVVLDDAVAIITAKREEDRRMILKTFDEDPELQMLNGRYGPYLSKGGKNYKLPKNKDLQAMTYSECLAIIHEADTAAPEKATGRKGRFRKKS